LHTVWGLIVVSKIKILEVKSLIFIMFQPFGLYLIIPSALVARVRVVTAQQIKAFTKTILHKAIQMEWKIAMNQNDRESHHGQA
jgi:hypothetical protein